MATSVTLKPNAIDISGSTSGTTTLQATAVAGTTTLTLPAATDTLVGKATTDTLTNKTLTGAVMNGTLGATTPSTVAATTISASSTATFAAGAAATPSITTTGDTNTGIFFPAADTIAFTEGGVEAMRLDSAGNMGLGVTPSAWNTGNSVRAMQFNGGSVWSFSNSVIALEQNAFYNGSGTYTYVATAAASDYYQLSGSHVWRIAPSGTAGNVISFTQAMTLDASGNLLVGTTSANPSAHHVLQYADDSKFAAVVANSSASTAALGLYIQYTALAPNSATSEFLYCGDTIGQKMSVKSNGGIYNFSANNSNLSDRREKTNFAPAGSYLDKICAIPVQTFNYIDQNLEEDDGLTLGVVAQDVQAVAPELVTETNWANKDEEPKMRLSIYQTDLQYALMKCIQEQQALITQLTARITALESA